MTTLSSYTLPRYAGDTDMFNALLYSLIDDIVEVMEANERGSLALVAAAEDALTDRMTAVDMFILTRQIARGAITPADLGDEYP